MTTTRPLDEATQAVLDLPMSAFVPAAEGLAAMIWLGDSDGRCIYLNKAQREFWGVAMADIPRFTWSSTLLPEDQTALFETFAEAMAAKRAFSVRARYRRADGVVRTLETKAQPRFAPNGEFLGMVGVNLDVTADEA